MEFWNALGIAETKDKEAITAAYHEKLRDVNPEDKPEEFMALRAAYESALKYASGDADENVPDEEKGPVDLWMDKVREVYADISRRCDPAEWDRLLADEVCESLDSRLDARNALLRFMMEHYRLPQEIYQKLDKQWDLRDSRAELYELFPRDFVDYAVINNITERTSILYELFRPEDSGEAVDKFISLCIRCKGELQEQNYEAVDATLAEIEQTGVKHPSYDLLLARKAYYNKDFEKALDISDGLLEKYPQIDQFHYMRGDCLRMLERHEEALAAYEAALAIDPKYGGALYGKAECLIALGRLEEAKDALYELTEIFIDDNSFEERIKTINKELVAQYAEREKTETFDFETTLKYAWCAYQNDDHEKAVSLLDSVTPETDLQRCDYDNIGCKLYLSMGNFNEALERARRWEQDINALEGDSKENDEQRKRLWRSVHIQGIALSALERYDEALQACSRSFAIDPTRADAIETRRRIYAITHQLDKMVEEAEKLVEVRPCFMNYYFLGLSQYEVMQKQDAFNSFGRAIEYDKNAAAYIQRARILCDYDQYDDAEEITNLLKENNIDDDNVKHIEARILEGRKHEDKALEIYRDIIARYEADSENNGNGIMWETYYLAALLEQDHKSLPELISMCEKGLECKEDYQPLLSVLAFFLDKNGEKQKAIDTYKKLIGINPRHGTAYTNIGNIYYDDLDDFETAAEYYEKQLTISETPRVHCFAGRAYLYQFNYDKAEEHFKKGLELDPNSPMIRTDLAMLYEYRHDYQSSYEILRQLAEEDEKNEQRNKGILRNYSRVLARLGRRDEAIDARLRNYSLFEDSDDAVKVIELCVEGGQADRAEGFIKQFRAAGKVNDEQYYCMMRDIYLLRRQIKPLVDMLKSLPDDSILKYSSLATYYRRLGKYKKADECYKKCDELEGPDGAIANCRLYNYKWMGDAEALKRETEHIQRNVDDLARRKWAYALYLTKMALIRTATDRPDEALPYIEQALAGPLCNTCKYPKCKDALVALAEYYYAKKQYSKALEVCREGLEIAADEYDFVAIPERIYKYHKKELKKERKEQ